MNVSIRKAHEIARSYAEAFLDEDAHQIFGVHPNTGEIIAHVQNPTTSEYYTFFACNEELCGDHLLILRMINEHHFIYN